MGIRDAELLERAISVVKFRKGKSKGAIPDGAVRAVKGLAMKLDALDTLGVSYESAVKMGIVPGGVIELLRCSASKLQALDALGVSLEEAVRKGIIPGSTLVTLKSLEVDLESLANSDVTPQDDVKTGIIHEDVLKRSDVGRESTAEQAAQRWIHNEHAIDLACQTLSDSGLGLMTSHTYLQSSKGLTIESVWDSGLLMRTIEPPEMEVEAENSNWQSWSCREHSVTRPGSDVARSGCHVLAPAEGKRPPDGKGVALLCAIGPTGPQCSFGRGAAATGATTVYETA